MVHTRVHANPRMTRFLVRETGVFQNSPVTVCDVGVRDGVDPFWSFFGQNLWILGFEPDLEAWAQLNSKLDGTRHKFYPIALGRQREKRPFSICHYAAGSSFYPANSDFLKRFPDVHQEQLQVVKTIETETIDLDTFVKEQQIPSIDFIKLDVEGSELDVLQGATHLLQTSVLGLSVEVLFHSSLRSQPTFSEIDLFLSSLGFYLFDLEIRRYARKTLTLPVDSLEATQIGQVLWGQALYFRDGVQELATNQPLIAWDQTRILKLACFMELLRLPDCAIELVEAGSHLLELDPQVLIERLTPK